MLYETNTVMTAKPQANTKAAPSSVIHINFVPGVIVFDARPIWAALNEAAQRGKISPQLCEEVQQDFGQKAIHLGTKHALLALAIADLRDAQLKIAAVLDETLVESHMGYRVVSGRTWEEARDRVLLAINSFLFEFRSFLELLAEFVYGILSGVGKKPADLQTVGLEQVAIVNKYSELKPHNFLRYLCHFLGVGTQWYEFLSRHRNFFTHEGCPYCAIEDLTGREERLDLLIMLTNIRDFQMADPADYFRVSELRTVIDGVRELSHAAQNHVLAVVNQL